MQDLQLLSRTVGIMWTLMASDLLTKYLACLQVYKMNCIQVDICQVIMATVILKEEGFACMSTLQNTELQFCKPVCIKFRWIIQVDGSSILYSIHACSSQRSISGIFAAIFGWIVFCSRWTDLPTLSHSTGDSLNHSTKFGPTLSGECRRLWPNVHVGFFQ